MADSSVGFDLTSLASFISAISGKDTSNANQAADAADPFRSQRAQYQPQIASLMADPSSILKDPTFTASLNLGGENLARQFGAKGMANSGNINAAEEQFGTTFAQNAIQQKLTNLMQLSGVNTGSPAAAGQALQTGQANTAAGVGSGLAGLDDIINQLMGPGAASSGLMGLIKQMFPGSSAPSFNTPNQGSNWSGSADPNGGTVPVDQVGSDWSGGVATTGDAATWGSGFDLNDSSSWMSGFDLP